MFKKSLRIVFELRNDKQIVNIFSKQKLFIWSYKNDFKKQQEVMFITAIIKKNWEKNISKMQNQTIYSFERLGTPVTSVYWGL